MSQIDCPEEDWPAYDYKCDEGGNNLTVSINGVSFGCSATCNFEVEYCRRTIPKDPSEDWRFDVQLTSINYFENDDCLRCARENMDELIELVHKKILVVEKENHYIEGTTWNANHLVLKSGCIRDDGIEYRDCGKQYGCCYRLIDITMNDEEPPEVIGYVERGDYYYNPQPYNCDGEYSRCNVRCGMIPELPLKPNCDDDCFYNEWEEGEPFTVPYMSNGCPGCSVTVYYNYRTVQYCSTPWKDYSITSVSFTEACNPCFGPQTAANIKQVYINYLLGGGGPLELPAFGDTKNEYRIIMAPCWKIVNPVTGGSYWQECGYDFCCTTTFSVTNIGGGSYTITELDRSGYVQECEDPNCFALCAEVPVMIPTSTGNEIKEKESAETFAVPNPASGNVDIYYSSPYSGIINIKLYDSQGALVYSTETRKYARDAVISVDLKNYQSGAYYYQFYVNGINTAKGSFIIKK